MHFQNPEAWKTSKSIRDTCDNIENIKLIIDGAGKELKKEHGIQSSDKRVVCIIRISSGWYITKSGMLLQKQNELLELACIASIVLNKRNSERVIATHA